MTGIEHDQRAGAPRTVGGDAAVGAIPSGVVVGRRGRPRLGDLRREGRLGGRDQIDDEPGRLAVGRRQNEGAIDRDGAGGVDDDARLAGREQAVAPGRDEPRPSSPVPFGRSKRISGRSITTRSGSASGNTVAWSPAERSMTRRCARCRRRRGRRARSAGRTGRPVRCAARSPPHRSRHPRSGRGYASSEHRREYRGRGEGEPPIRSARDAELEAVLHSRPPHPAIRRQARDRPQDHHGKVLAPRFPPQRAAAALTKTYAGGHRGPHVRARTRAALAKQPMRS